MVVLPHNFPSLRRSGAAEHRRSLLIMGAGMSFGLVPGPGTLCQAKRRDAERALNCTTSLAPDDFDLYKWADEVLAHLESHNDPNPKLTLAQSLDITSDPRWRGCAGTERNTPRHRVIARFAREGLWEQIWSLNWDCIQERALENVGLVRDGKEAGLPWPTVFRAFITAAECGAIAADKTVKVIKPHGCVMALAAGEEAMRRGDLPRARQLASRFLITASELASLAPAPGNPTQHFIFASLSTELSSHPLIVGGWSVSEEYLLKYIDENVRPVLQQQRLAVDELCIIDIHFNDKGHTRLAGFYGKARASTHIPVSDLTTDGLFLWIQTLYALDCLRGWAAGKDRLSIEDLAARLNQPPDSPSFVTRWVDSFLPVWVRLCWRCGLVDCFNSRGEPVAAHEIPLESRDEHIPWHIENIRRPDLGSAAM